MIQTRPYEFMVKFTPQREWVERQGILFWLAFFFIELGAGMFIVASVFDSLLGMLIGWLICAVLGGSFHLLYLGHPLRFWRILIYPSGLKTSWITRGMYFLVTFLVLGLVHMILAQWASPAAVLLIAADVFAFLAVIYGGFALAYVNGLKLWNSPVIPLLFTVAGILGGVGLTIATVLATDVPAVLLTLETWARLFLIGYALLLIVYLLSIRYSGDTSKASVGEMIGARWAPLFWVIVVALGIVLPLVVALVTWAGDAETPTVVLYFVISFELLGDLSLRYCILKCAYYEPLVPHTSYA